MRDDGKTQQAIGDEVGLSQNRVSEILSEKGVMTPKTDTPKRTRTVLQITQYTKPFMTLRSRLLPLLWFMRLGAERR